MTRAVAVAEQVDDDVEHLGLDEHRFAVAAELEPILIEFELTEPGDHRAATPEHRRDGAVLAATELT